MGLTKIKYINLMLLKVDCETYNSIASFWLDPLFENPAIKIILSFARRCWRNQTMAIESAGCWFVALKEDSFKELLKNVELHNTKKATFSDT